MPTKQQNQPGKNGYKYREQHGVIVICSGEKHQEQVFARLKEQGHKLKVVTV